MMKFIRLGMLSLVFAGAILSAGSSARATTVTVNATDDIFYVGLLNPPSSPNGAGTPATTVSVIGGQTYSIMATGNISTGGTGVTCCNTDTSIPYTGANGYAGLFGLTGSNIQNSTGSAVGNYSDPTHQFALVGWYQGASTVFTIGSSGSVVIPKTDSVLYLGFADGSGFRDASGFYGDNSGSLSVNVSAVPEPSTWAMMILGFCGLGFISYRKKQSGSAFRFA